MSSRNDIRKEIMAVPEDGSVMTGEDVADYLAKQTTGWEALSRFTRHHNALVNGVAGTENLPYQSSDVLDEPLYRREAVLQWVNLISPKIG